MHGYKLNAYIEIKCTIYFIPAQAVVNGELVSKEVTFQDSGSSPAVVLSFPKVHCSNFDNYTK